MLLEFLSFNREKIRKVYIDWGGRRHFQVVLAMYKETCIGQFVLQTERNPEEYESS